MPAAIISMLITSLIFKLQYVSTFYVDLGMIGDLSSKHVY